jgi:hypothetical protein
MAHTTTDRRGATVNNATQVMVRTVAASVQRDSWNALPRNAEALEIQTRGDLGWDHESIDSAWANGYDSDEFNRHAVYAALAAVDWQVVLDQIKDATHERFTTAESDPSQGDYDDCCYCGMPAPWGSSLCWPKLENHEDAAN